MTQVTGSKVGVRWPLWQLSTQAEVLTLLTRVGRSSAIQVFAAEEELAP